MMTRPSQIAEAALRAGMQVPPDPDGEFDTHAFPHFATFCVVQLGRSVVWGEHWDNARIVASVPPERIERVTLRELRDLGLSYPWELLSG